jgi:hypothetical protein
LDHHTGHPARHDARILLLSASSMPSEFFHRRFDLIGSLLPIGRHSTSLHSSRLHRSAVKLICSFFFWTDVHAIRPIDSSTTLS